MQDNVCAHAHTHSPHTHAHACILDQLSKSIYLELIVLVLVARTALHSLAHTISSARARVCVSVCVGSLSSKASDVPAICVYNICARWNKNRRCNHVYVRHTHPPPRRKVRVCVHVRAMSCREAAVGDGRSRNTLCACARASAHTHTKTHYLSILLFL
jgi:hypothetical protein